MSYADHLERVQRRNDRIVSSAHRRFLDPPDDEDDPTCPVCGEEPAEDWERGFMTPDGWEGGHVYPCHYCKAPCVSCGAEKVVKVRKGRCAECSARRTKKARRLNGLLSRPKARRRLKLYKLTGVYYHEG